jgi:hypothetical protein
LRGVPSGGLFSLQDNNKPRKQTQRAQQATQLNTCHVHSKPHDQTHVMSVHIGMLTGALLIAHVASSMEKVACIMELDA